MIVTIPDYRPPTWNKFYAGMHYRKRIELASEAHLLVLAATKQQHPDCEPFDVCIDIEVTVYFKNRPQDTDNVTAKLLIDGLRHAGVIAEDTPVQVGAVTTRSRVDKERPRVEIRLHPSEN